MTIKSEKMEVEIDASLEVLIPEFFDDIENVLKDMEKFLEKDDFANVRILGHGYKGAAASYTIDDLSTIFLEIEKASNTKNKENITAYIQKVNDYIKNINIKYI